MKGVMEREFIAQLVIILVVSLGGWMTLVQPKVRQYREIQTIFQAVSHNSSDFSESAVEELADMLTVGRRRIDTIEERNRLADNTTLLFGMVSGIGAEHEVTVQSLTPGTSIARTGETEFSVTRIDIVLEGPYERIGSFLKSIRELPGFLRPVSLTLKPAGEDGYDLTMASYSCEILHFPIPQELQEIGALP